MTQAATGQRRLKLLIYSANFAPEPTGIGKYSGEMAAWLAVQGHDVRVVCAPPYYPQWKVAQHYRWPPYRRERWCGVDVWRAPLWVPASQGGLQRVLHLASFALASLPVVLRQALWRPDVVFSVAPFLTCAPAGWLTARLSGARAWLHVQDFEVDVAFGMGLLRGALVRRLVLAAERQLLRRFDRVSSISRRMNDRLLDKGVEPARVALLPNWVDLASVRPWPGVSRYRRQLGIADDAIVALFSGTLGVKQSLLTIVEAARLMSGDAGIVFVICGDGPMKPVLESAGHGLRNLRLLPLQPVADLPELLGLADLHLLTQSADAEDLVLPSKLTGMLASGRPVVATARPGAELAAVVAPCGAVVEPENSAALAAAVAALAALPDKRRALGETARRTAELRMGQQSVLSNLERQLHSLIPAGEPRAEHGQG